jgi:hypothetical protein
MARSTLKSRLRNRLRLELEGQRAAYQRGPETIIVYRNEGTPPAPDTTAALLWASGHAPEGWPEGLPLPLTAGEAIAAFDRSIGAMAEQIAADIRHAADLLVRPELVDRALRWEGLTERWPLSGTPFSAPEAKRLSGEAAAGWAARRALGSSAVTAIDIHKERPGLDVEARAMEWFRGWPGEAAPSLVAEWARDAFNGIAPGMGDELADSADAGRIAGLILMDNDDHGMPRGIPAGGIALLYLAESACRMDTGPFDIAPISVDRPAMRTMTALAGAHPGRHEKRAGAEVRPDDDDRPTRLFFTWDDRTEVQLELGLYDDMAPLEAIGRRYGDAAVRDLLTLYFCTFAARRPAGEVFWWWIDEHLELNGLPDTKDNRRRLREWLTRMTKTKLVAHYGSGPPLTGPLVSVVLSDGDSFKIHLHPALFRGVETAEGVGSHWWPVPRSVLALPADGTAGKVHVLAPVLGQQWRQDLVKNKKREGGPLAFMRADTLTERLGIHRRKDRKNDTKAARKLRVTMEAGVAGGLIGKWWVERGDLESGTGIVYSTPGPESMGVVSSRPARLPRPPRLPDTGAELRSWLSHRGLSSKAGAELLGVAASALRNWTARGSRPLPKKARAAIRLALWTDN